MPSRRCRNLWRKEIAKREQNSGTTPPTAYSSRSERGEFLSRTLMFWRGTGLDRASSNCAIQKATKTDFCSFKIIRAWKKTARHSTAQTANVLADAVGASRMNESYRISGHESFPCRYTWLPKAVRGIATNPMLFSDEDAAMVSLGVGKNMVRSIRFWSQAAGMSTTAKKGGGHSLTTFGREILGENGRDPFLEDIRTLWLIHWKLSTDIENPLLAWDYLLNRWQEPDLVPSTVVKALHKEATMGDAGLSRVTVQQHFDTFLHTYVPTRGRKREIQEDNLDCPLVELELIVKVGDRDLETSSGRREPIYSFRREEKPDITPELFIFCLNDFWQKRHPTDATLTLKEVAHGHGSPGQIFKLPEEDVRVRVDELARQTDGFFSYSESVTQQQVRKQAEVDSVELLRDIYDLEGAYA